MTATRRCCGGGFSPAGAKLAVVAGLLAIAARLPAAGGEDVSDGDAPTEANPADNCATDADCTALGDPDAKCSFGGCACTTPGDTTSHCWGDKSPSMTTSPVVLIFAYDVSCTVFFANLSRMEQIRRSLQPSAISLGLSTTVSFSCGSLLVVVEADIPLKDISPFVVAQTAAMDTAAGGTELEGKRVSAVAQIQSASENSCNAQHPATARRRVPSTGQCMVSDCAKGYDIVVESPDYVNKCSRMEMSGEEDISAGMIAGIVLGIMMFVGVIITTWLVCNDSKEFADGGLSNGSGSEPIELQSPSSTSPDLQNWNV
eukprot:TRINITY_DN7606_c0_g1_i1.p1 TRINITY_DN7606_c0_g1~~TRINITY_DN7606_c0_g1_i1.p1  ORF type:complete len:328 (+),score=71.60 TRINITY_DN7606_c0_g1_i1:41-985(+)